MENLDSKINMTDAPAGGAILRSRPIGLNIGVTAYTLWPSLLQSAAEWRIASLPGACSRRDRDIHRVFVQFSQGPPARSCKALAAP